MFVEDHVTRYKMNDCKFHPFITAHYEKAYEVIVILSQLRYAAKEPNVLYITGGKNNRIKIVKIKFRAQA